MTIGPAPEGVGTSPGRVAVPSVSTLHATATPATASTATASTATASTATASTATASTATSAVSSVRRRGRCVRLDAGAFASAGIPLTLLMDLADPSGPDSESIYWAEPVEGDLSWIS